MQHQYFWQHPHPAKPEEMPRFEASHELDMKKLRDDKGRKGGPARPAPAPLAGPDAKRPRTTGPGGGHNPYNQPPAQQSYDQRCPPPKPLEIFRSGRPPLQFWLYMNVSPYAFSGIKERSPSRDSHLPQ